VAHACPDDFSSITKGGLLAAHQPSARSETRKTGRQPGLLAHRRRQRRSKSLASQSTGDSDGLQGRDERLRARLLAELHRERGAGARITGLGRTCQAVAGRRSARDAGMRIEAAGGRLPHPVKTGQLSETAA